MKNLLENFLQYLSLQRHVSPHTLRSYESDLKQFLTFLTRTKSAGDPPDPARVDHRVLRAFLAELQVAGIRKSSTARKLAALRSFFKYLHRTGKIPENPARPLLTPKQEKPLPTFLTREEAHHLMAAPEGDTLAILRDRAILETFYSSGLRVAELAGLTLENLSLDEGFLRVRGKGNKERIVPLGSQAVAAIQAYLRARSDTPRALFLNLRGGTLTSRGIYDIVRKYAGPLSPHKRVTPHSLRHSFASHLLDGGADLRSVQEMLGHANLSTTQKYTHVTVDRLMAVYDQAHPRSKKGVEEPEENQ